MELVLAANAGWKRVPHVKINEMVYSMIERMEQMIAFGGLMTKVLARQDLGVPALQYRFSLVVMYL